MAGSIRKRPDRGTDAWELRVYLGRDARGRVRQRSTLYRGTRRQAEHELARLVVDQDTDPVALPRQDTAWGPATTVNDAIRGWKLNGWDDLSPNTVRRYESLWRLHVRDEIGEARIDSLGPYDIERYLRRLKAEGRGETTVRHLRAFLHRACRLARKWSGNRLPNPVADTELPEWPAEGRGEVRSPTVEEVRAVLAAARAYDQRVAAFARVIAATGARRGEVCAIRWNDVDWSGSIRIDEGIIARQGGAAVKAPKTRASVRRVSVDLGTLAVLEALRDGQALLAAQCGVQVGVDGFVFSKDPSGSLPPHPDAMSQAFRRICKRAGVAPDIHLHSLRHFQATELDPVISEAQKQARLGWATVHMARHYTGAITAEDRRAAEHMGQVLG
ncbi:MAG: tyrosine-type recombinase/integrase [Acidimicrobiales bacterium]